MAAKETKKAETAKKVTRDQAANEVVSKLKGSTTLTALAQEADALFVAGGGKSDPKSQSYYVRRALETAAALGILKLTRPTDVLVERT